LKSHLDLTDFFGWKYHFDAEEQNAPYK
jgi:hypothetical protein